ncbi:MAG: hypothetical protein L3J78_01550, partial [Thermoplasmata archaeon]|nr:hypothetical protein [Thermoplasmata archaeon]
MGRPMSAIALRRACALSVAFAIVVLGVTFLVPAAHAAPNPPTPAAAMTVTVVLNKGGYLSGDVATAQAVVYRTPAPSNYTYTWRVLDLFGNVLNTTTNGPPTFTYTIPLTFNGFLRFEATVNDGQGLIIIGRTTVNVVRAILWLNLDRGDFNPGDIITAFYGVTSNVMTRPTYNYTVIDSLGTNVASQNTNSTTFSFATPRPASRTYFFTVIATDRGNTTQASVSIAQASGFVLGVTFDRDAYAAGDTIKAHVKVTTRGTAALPSQFRWSLSLGFISVSSITTTPEADLALTIPAGTGNGNVLVFASESSTG